MKPIKNISGLRYHAAGFIVSLIALAGADAAAIVYYQLEGVAGSSAGGAGGIVDSSGNTGRNATASAYGTGGSTPTYSSEIAGAVIRDGVGGSVVNAANSTSLRFINPGPSQTTPNYATQAGGKVALSSAAAPIQPASFTVEAFIKVGQKIQYANMIGKERTSSTPTWQLDNNSNTSTATTEPTSLTLRVRTDHQTSGGDPADGFNQNIAGSGTPASILATTTGPGMESGWHHIAMTYDDTDNRFRLFVDYVEVASDVLKATTPYDAITNPEGSKLELVYTAGDFVFGGAVGGRGFDGWMDEVRFSDQVLGSNQFLRVDIIPEPSHAMLLLTGLTAFGLRRRR